MNHDLWWLSWTVKDLSPLNPEAVVAAQLNPTEDWLTASQQECGPDQFSQLWWLCWYARPDLRELALRQLGAPIYSVSLYAIIHPETLAEWSEPPRWADSWLRAWELDIRRAMLFSVPLTVEQCRNLHPDLWNSMSLAFQAGQSVALPGITYCPRSRHCQSWLRARVCRYIPCDMA